MRKCIRFITSMPVMGTSILLLALGMALATFIENSYGTNAAKSLIYNNWWFEGLFVLLSINLITNLFKYNLFKKSQFPILLFHIAFIVILIGAAITRYSGYEGTLHIRQGSSTNVMLSADTFVQLEVTTPNDSIEKSIPTFFSMVTPYEVNKSLINGLQVKSTAFIPNCAFKPRESINGNDWISLSVQTPQGAQTFWIEKNSTKQIENLEICYNMSPQFHTKYILSFESSDQQVSISGNDSITIQPLTDSSKDTIINKAQKYPLNGPSIIKLRNNTVIINGIHFKSELHPVYQPQNPQLLDAVMLTFEKNDQTKLIVLTGKKGVWGQWISCYWGENLIKARYGAIPIKLPFTMHLNQFKIDRYPGSETPSGFASDITLIAPEEKPLQYTISMNHILNYNGYRFFQSSYDNDQKGTILTVNHDPIGTTVVYIGYFLLAIGMFTSLLTPKSRFRRLSGMLKNNRSVAIIITLMISTSTFSQVPTPPIIINKEIANDFGKIWTQGADGRIEPMNTLTSEITRKLVKHNRFRGFNSDEFVLSLIVNSEYWKSFPLITVNHPDIRQLLHLTNSKAAFNDFFNSPNEYLLYNEIGTAWQKNPSERDKKEQELIKIDEQVNVLYQIISGKLFKINPAPDKTWSIPHDSGSIAVNFNTLIKAIEFENTLIAIDAIQNIRTTQNDIAGKYLPSDKHATIEIYYNKINLFLLLMPILMISGFILLILKLYCIISGKSLEQFFKIIYFFLFTTLCIYTLGLIVRWYISQHAPWSNGYESMVYVGWSSLLAGMIFGKKNALTTSIGAIFASILLMVAHLSWMNPEITPLVPVLKSKWLTIHVAVIVASYGFLGLGGFIGLINLIQMIIRNQKNQSRISVSIKEMEIIGEMALTIGLYLITIGAFLGGIWANESWGRYWGWDAKETWSAVTIAVYAFVLHSRLIPGLKTSYAFNLLSFIAFGSVIMTYWGVNYYLSGMHSYAQGQPTPVPIGLYVGLTLTAAIAIWAGVKTQKSV